MDPPALALRAEIGGFCAQATARGPGPGALYILLLGSAPPSPRAVAIRAPFLGLAAAGGRPHAAATGVRFHR
jgi:hypothetical protein